MMRSRNRNKDVLASNIVLQNLLHTRFLSCIDTAKAEEQNNHSAGLPQFSSLSVRTTGQADHFSSLVRTAGQQVVTIVVLGSLFFDRDQLQNYGNDHARGSNQDAEHPKLPAQWHSGCERAQELDDDGLENCSANHDAKEYPASK
nr:hypothetical protein Iba_scaffold613882CG0010 [Ipomoea batatas]